MGEKQHAMVKQEFFPIPWWLLFTGTQNDRLSRGQAGEVSEENLVQFSKAKCNVLNLGQGNP